MTGGVTGVVDGPGAGVIAGGGVGIFFGGGGGLSFFACIQFISVLREQSLAQASQRPVKEG